MQKELPLGCARVRRNRPGDLMIKESYWGIYATAVYLPFSALSKNWRNYWRRRRNREAPHMQDMVLPSLSWRRCVTPRSIRILEHRSINGNVRISELGILAQMATNCSNGSNIFEIGTFDGRTTLNLALNAPRKCSILTLDMPPNTETEYSLCSGERHFVEKTEPGLRYKKHRADRADTVARITQLTGDSATFDFSPYWGTCSLVFIDGAHTFDYVLSDTDAALELVGDGGIIVWHDYGVWEGVTRALEAVANKRKLALKNIKGTSLVFWRNADNRK